MNFPNIKELTLSTREVQTPPEWTHELLKRVISDNFKESCYVHIDAYDQLDDADPFVSVTKNFFKKPKNTFRNVTFKDDVEYFE